MSHDVVIVDLGFGDQGKGTLTDFLVRDLGARLVVRYNGGAQAAHRVVTDDGRRHVFAQLGAGSFVPGVQTFLSRFVAVCPWALAVEARHLARAGVSDGLARTWLSERAPLITPFHGAANRIRERARGDARHGSCGLGVGETMADAATRDAADVLRAADLDDPGLGAKLARIQARKREELAPVIAAMTPDQRAASADDLARLSEPSLTLRLVHELASVRRETRLARDTDLRGLLDATPAAVFEGAQGVLLDADFGFHPHTTWSSCTSAQALALRSEAGRDGLVTRLGVLRAYATRHGAGPFPTETPALVEHLPEPNDFGVMNPWQGDFRVGWFDAVTTRYAIDANGGIDALAITCLDRLADLPEWRLADAWEADGAVVTTLPLPRAGDLAAQTALGRLAARARPRYLTSPPAACLDVIERTVSPVALVSSGPCARDKRWRTRPE